MGSLQGVPLRFESARKIPARTLVPGDIILEISGGTKERPTGRTIFASESLLAQSDLPVLPASFCRLIRPNSSAVIPRYLYYWLQDMYAQGGTWKYQNQSTGLANFQMEVFLDSEMVRLPSMDEQQRIADVLGSLDDFIEANRHLNFSLASLQSAIFARHWDGERRVRLADVTAITMGQSPPGDTYNESGEGTVFYQGTRDFGWRFPGRRIWTTQPTRLAGAGDILVSVRAPVGAVNVATEDTALGRGVGALRAMRRPSTLLQALLVDTQLWDIHQGTGTVFASVNRADLENLMVPWVENDDVESTLAVLDDAILQLTRESEELVQARDELLPLLMSGRVRVLVSEDFEVA